MTISRDEQRVDDNQDARGQPGPHGPFTRPSNFTNTAVYTIKLAATPSSRLMSSRSHWRSHRKYNEGKFIILLILLLREIDSFFPKLHRRDARSFFLLHIVFTRIASCREKLLHFSAIRRDEYFFLRTSCDLFDWLLERAITRMSADNVERQIR